MQYSKQLQQIPPACLQESQQSSRQSSLRGIVNFAIHVHDSTGMLLNTSCHRNSAVTQSCRKISVEPKTLNNCTGCQLTVQVVISRTNNCTLGTQGSKHFCLTLDQQNTASCGGGHREWYQEEKKTTPISHEPHPKKIILMPRESTQRVHTECPNRESMQRVHTESQTDSPNRESTRLFYTIHALLLHQHHTQTPV